MTKIKYKNVESQMYDELCLSYKKKYKKKEEWKRVIIDGVTSKYAISNYGRIMNTDKNMSSKINIINDHYKVYIKLDDKSYRIIGTYRLVALMFIPVPQKYLDMGYKIEDLYVDHKRDGEPDNFDDNTVWNLQWLTPRENTSKASKCGIKDPYQKGFREHLDKMILDGCDNKYIYSVCLNEYGLLKEEIKGNLQVRRRRLGKTLKPHFENDKEYTAKVDELIKAGKTNKEIYEILDMDTGTRSAGRLIQYRRSILGIQDQTSKFFTNDENAKVNLLLECGYSNKEILEKMGMVDLDDGTRVKILQTLGARRHQLKVKQEKELNNDCVQS